ncbi:MAG: hypothetical protein RIB59_03735 [Rhodospirillales bacterium]
MADTVPPVLPTAAGAPPSGTAAPANAPAVTVPTPPPGLSHVAIGTAIQGTVVPSDTTGIVRIQTPVGLLNVPTHLALPNNALLTLLLQSLTPQARLLITAINGQIPALTLQKQSASSGGAQAGGGTQTGAAQIPAVSAAQTASPSVSFSPAQVLTATLLGRGTPGPQPSAPNTPGQAAAQTSPGAAQAALQSTTAIGALANLAKSAAARIGLPQTPGTAPAAPNANPAPLTASAPATPLQPGTRVPLRIVSLQPPAPNAPAPPLPPLSPQPLSQGQVLSGIVTGAAQAAGQGLSQTAGQTLVQTPAGQLSLPTATPLPQGTGLIFEIAGRPLAPPPPADTQTAALLDRFHLAREWPALKEALQVLHETNPLAAQHVINSVIPRLDTQLAANIIFFLLALRGNDIRGWLGEDTMRTLDDARPGLATQLRGEFGQLSRIAEDPIAGDWRLALIPLHNGETVEQIHLFMRRRKKQDDKGDTETRFVLDIGLSQLGRLQLDGLIGERDKRLDLIIRSQSPLPGMMQNDIRTIFINAGEITGMKGGLSFQAAPPNFVEIPASAPNRAGGLIA